VEGCERKVAEPNTLCIGCFGGLLTEEVIRTEDSAISRTRTSSRRWESEGERNTVPDRDVFRSAFWKRWFSLQGSVQRHA
jgi:hypothetical protein